MKTKATKEELREMLVRRAEAAEHKCLVMMDVIKSLENKNMSSEHWHNKWQTADAQLKKLKQIPSGSMTAYRSELIAVASRIIAFGGYPTHNNDGNQQVCVDEALDIALMLIAAVDKYIASGSEAT